MRRGQLFSMDALISLVLVIMILSAVSVSSENLRSDITSMIGWYERANIADSMLDVLTKSPGEPEDWEVKVDAVRLVGLGNRNYSFALDYAKIIALNKSKVKLKPILAQLAQEKDFLFEIYVSKFNVSVSGGFPRVYLNNITLIGKRGSQQVNFDIRNATHGSPQFRIINVTLERDGVTYTNGEICGLLSPPGGVEVGDIIKIVPAGPVEISAQLHGEQFRKVIPAGSVIEIVILDTGSKLNLYDNPHDCYKVGHVTGHGQVIVRLSAYDNTFPIINSTRTSAEDFLERGKPFYWFSLINGTFENNISEVMKSMSNSPWIEPIERRSIFMRPPYNLSAGPSREAPLVYGFMKYNVLSGEFVNITVNSMTTGNLTLITQLGTEVRGLFVYGNKDNLNATLVWYDYKDGNIKPRIKAYTSNNGVILIPFRELFGSTNTKDKLIVMWLYSLKGWTRKDVKIQFVPDIEYMIEPKFDKTVIKLWVWDDS